jgi:hypothetical protein
MTITNAPEGLSVPHVIARASQSFRESMEVYCRSTGLLRTCTWYHGKRGGCVGDVSTLVGLQPTRQPFKSAYIFVINYPVKGRRHTTTRGTQAKPNCNPRSCAQNSAWPNNFQQDKRDASQSLFVCRET